MLNVDRKDPLLGYKGFPTSNRQFSVDDLLSTLIRKELLEMGLIQLCLNTRMSDIQVKNHLNLQGTFVQLPSSWSPASSSKTGVEKGKNMYPYLSEQIDYRLFVQVANEYLFHNHSRTPTEQEELNKGKTESLKLSRQGPYFPYFYNFLLNHPSHYLSGGGYMLSGSQNKSIHLSVFGTLCPENSTDVLQGPVNEEEQKQEDLSNNSDLLSHCELSPTRSRMLSDDVSLPHDQSHETSDNDLHSSFGPVVQSISYSSIPAKIREKDKHGLQIESKPIGDHHTIEESESLKRSRQGPYFPYYYNFLLNHPSHYLSGGGYMLSGSQNREDLSFSSTSSSQIVSPSTPSSFTFPDQSPPSSQVFQPLVLQSGAQEIWDLWSFHELGGDSAPQVELDAAVTAVTCSVTNTQPARSQIQTLCSGPALIKRVYGSLPCSHSFPSLSHMTSAENNTLTRACSLPELRLEASCEQFTPDISDDEDDETYRFQCSCPGLYQCSVTGLVFHMEQEGDVVYRTVPWNRKLLSQHHKQPAGPLFDIKCEQQSVCQLHLPHCQIRSTGTPQFLLVAHVNEEGIEFIVPHKITETHVIINISGLSAFGNVKDEDSPDPVQALVLLFYRPPVNPEPSSLLNVLLLPRNVVLRDVLRTRKKLVGDENYIETSPQCKLHPQQEYTLSTCPEDDTVLVDPTKAEFECDNYDNYFPSFQVDLEQTRKHIKLFLRHTTSYSVWERRVCLWSSGVNRSCGQSALNLPPNQRLWDIRSSFIEGVSAPVLKSLLDKLFEKTVMTDSEQESANEMQNKRDKARFVIDTVRKKGEAASSEMIEALCDVDPFLSEHLGLI